MTESWLNQFSPEAREFADTLFDSFNGTLKDYVLKLARELPTSSEFLRNGSETPRFAKSVPASLVRKVSADLALRAWLYAVAATITKKDLALKKPRRRRIRKRKGGDPSPTAEPTKEPAAVDNPKTDTRSSTRAPGVIKQPPADKNHKQRSTGSRSTRVNAPFDDKYGKCIVIVETKNGGRGNGTVCNDPGGSGMNVLVTAKHCEPAAVIIGGNRIEMKTHTYITERDILLSIPSNRRVAGAFSGLAGWGFRGYDSGKKVYYGSRDAASGPVRHQEVKDFDLTKPLHVYAAPGSSGSPLYQLFDSKPCFIGCLITGHEATLERPTNHGYTVMLNSPGGTLRAHTTPCQDIEFLKTSARSTRGGSTLGRLLGLLAFVSLFSGGSASQCTINPCVTKVSDSLVSCTSYVVDSSCILNSELAEHLGYAAFRPAALPADCHCSILSLDATDHDTNTYLFTVASIGDFDPLFVGFHGSGVTHTFDDEYHLLDTTYTAYDSAGPVPVSTYHYYHNLIVYAPRPISTLTARCSYDTACSSTIEIPPVWAGDELFLSKSTAGFPVHSKKIFNGTGTGVNIAGTHIVPSSDTSRDYSGSTSYTFSGVMGVCEYVFTPVLNNAWFRVDGESLVTGVAAGESVSGEVTLTSPFTEAVSNRQYHVLLSGDDCRFTRCLVDVDANSHRDTHPIYPNNVGDSTTYQTPVNYTLEFLLSGDTLTVEVNAERTVRMYIDGSLVITGEHMDQSLKVSCGDIVTVKVGNNDAVSNLVQCTKCTGREDWFSRWSCEDPFTMYTSIGGIAINLLFFIFVVVKCCLSHQSRTAAMLATMARYTDAYQFNCSNGQIPDGWFVWWNFISQCQPGMYYYMLITTVGFVVLIVLFIVACSCLVRVMKQRQEQSQGQNQAVNIYGNSPELFSTSGATTNPFTNYGTIPPVTPHKGEKICAKYGLPYNTTPKLAALASLCCLVPGADATNVSCDTYDSEVIMGSLFSDHLLSTTLSFVLLLLVPALVFLVGYAVGKQFQRTRYFKTKVPDYTDAHVDILLGNEMPETTDESDVRNLLTNERYVALTFDKEVFRFYVNTSMNSMITYIGKINGEKCFFTSRLIEDGCEIVKVEPFTGMPIMRVVWLGPRFVPVAMPKLPVSLTGLLAFLFLLNKTHALEQESLTFAGTLSQFVCDPTFEVVISLVSFAYLVLVIALFLLGLRTGIKFLISTIDVNVPDVGSARIYKCDDFADNNVCDPLLIKELGVCDEEFLEEDQDMKCLTQEYHIHQIPNLPACLINLSEYTDVIKTLVTGMDARTLRLQDGKFWHTATNIACTVFHSPKTLTRSMIFAYFMTNCAAFTVPFNIGESVDFFVHDANNQQKFTVDVIATRYNYTTTLEYYTSEFKCIVSPPRVSCPDDNVEVDCKEYNYLSYPPGQQFCSIFRNVYAGGLASPAHCFVPTQALQSSSGFCYPDVDFDTKEGFHSVVTTNPSGVEVDVSVTDGVNTQYVTIRAGSGFSRPIELNIGSSTFTMTFSQPSIGPGYTLGQLLLTEELAYQISADAYGQSSAGEYGDVAFTTAADIYFSPDILTFTSPSGYVHNEYTQSEGAIEKFHDNPPALLDSVLSYGCTPVIRNLDVSLFGCNFGFSDVLVPEGTLHFLETPVRASVTNLTCSVNNNGYYSLGRNATVDLKWVSKTNGQCQISSSNDISPVAVQAEHEVVTITIATNGAVTDAIIQLCDEEVTCHLVSKPPPLKLIPYSEYHGNVSKLKVEPKAYNLVDHTTRTGQITIGLIVTGAVILAILISILLCYCHFERKGIEIEGDVYVN